jgi:putative ABC transport system permease protein
MNAPMYLALFACAIALLLLFATLVARNKSIFTMGVRNIVRRPKSAAIIIGALLASTAIISGSLVASSSLSYSVVKQTYDALGNVDETIAVNGQPFNYSVFQHLGGNSTITNNTDGLSPSLYGGVPSVDDVTSGITSKGVTLVGLNFSLDAPFGEFTLINGTQTNASDLSASQVLINEKLAQDLNAHVGDRLAVYYGENASSAKAYTFTVKYIAKNEGKAQYELNENLFMQLTAAQAVFQHEGQINEIRVSNLGDAESGAAKSSNVSALLTHALQGSPQRFDINQVKQNMLDAAGVRGAQFLNLLVVLGTFSIITSAMLIVNVFVTLSEQRRSELGLARAFGMKRRHVILLFLSEGVTCALLAAAIGSILGIGIGAALINTLNAAVTGGSPAGASLVLHYDPTDLLIAFLTGLLVTITTLTFASYRISRLNIVRAIRNAENSEQGPRLRRGAPLLGVGLTVFGFAAYGLFPQSLAARVLAPTLIIFGLALVGLRAMKRAQILTLAGGALVLYNAGVLFSASGFSNFAATLTFTISGLLLVLGAVLMVLVNATFLLKLFSKPLAGRKASQALLRSSSAYCLQKRETLGIKVTILAFVIFLMIVALVIAAIYQPDIGKQTGGYDIRATSSTPLSNLTSLQVQSPPSEQPPSKPVALLNESDIEFYDGLFVANATGTTVNGQALYQQGPETNVYGVDANFSGHAQYNFKETVPGFNSSKEVWNLLNYPNYVIVDSSYSYGRNGTQINSGDAISFKTANGTARFLVAGVLDEFYLHGIFMSKQQMQHYFPQNRGDTLFLIKSGTGMKPIDLSYDLRKGYKAAGINAFLIRDEVLQMTTGSQQLFQLTATYLGLGLIVGLASVGVVTVRSTIERRQEIGIMRAIGFTRGLVVKSLLFEATFATTLAVAIGLSAGVVVSYAIYTNLNQTGKVPFTVPVIQVTLVLLIVYLAIAICTAIPARNVSRTLPAEAIRYVE